jgi:ribosomal-protein-alanine N-acetyltransferase
MLFKITHCQGEQRSLDRFAALAARYDIERHFWSYPQVVEALKVPDTVLLMVEFEDAPEGFLLARRMDETVELFYIFVAEKLRGRKIAKALMLKLEEVFCGTAQEIFLEVRPSNNAARLLYASLGFQVIAVRRKYYSDGEDALIMCRLLKER